jgi:toxin ParE1/3/4
MRPRRVILTGSATDDLASLIRFLVRNGASVRVARDYVGRIRRRCVAIGDAPFGGRPRDDLAPGLRTVPFEASAIILYTIEDDQVLISNIFYGGRDYEALYRPVDET